MRSLATDDTGKETDESKGFTEDKLTLILTSLSEGK